jgi:hypothetical protein
MGRCFCEIQRLIDLIQMNSKGEMKSQLGLLMRTSTVVHSKWTGGTRQFVCKYSVVNAGTAPQQLPPPRYPLSSTRKEAARWAVRHHFHYLHSTTVGERFSIFQLSLRRMHAFAGIVSAAASMQGGSPLHPQEFHPGAALLISSSSHSS